MVHGNRGIVLAQSSTRSNQCHVTIAPDKQMGIIVLDEVNLVYETWTW